jgi:mRNA interferase YafQ
MRTIKFTNRFKRDFKREKAGRSRHHSQKLNDGLMEVVRLLAADAALPPRTAPVWLR